jgi:TonB family protein
MIVPPRKLTNLAPTYPPGAAATGVEGNVALEARVGEDGLIRDIRVTGDAPGDLAAAAIDAVSQWEFTPTLLNCTPVDVGISVTVKFALNR